jgi:hypothetical protein
MRTTIDLPDELMKQVKLKAVEEEISLKKLFIRSLENELGISSSGKGETWKDLKGSGSAGKLSPGEKSI